MPLTKQGRKLKGLFVKEYGKHRGINIFYAYEHKHPEMHLVRLKHMRLYK